LVALLRGGAVLEGGPKFLWEGKLANSRKTLTGKEGEDVPAPEKEGEDGKKGMT